MWFNGFGFWLFFALAALIHAFLTHELRNRFLVLASLAFYWFLDAKFIWLILLCIGINYVTAERIAASENAAVRKRWLIGGVTLSLGILGCFKYLGFFTKEASQLLASLGWIDSPWVVHLALPVGISFFTFHALSYTIDVYRGETEPCASIWDFALFISFFPQLIAGPINRSTQLLPQILHPRPALDEGRFRKGFYLVLSGLFLKVVVADNMAWLANHAFLHPTSSLLGSDVLLGTYAFAVQIYGDFAGYTAIACGTSCWLGFDLMDNFRRPYFALDPRDFWSRWHISLSTWLRDYLYIPLGGNRHGPSRTAVNLFLTMLLGGLWHGAAWTFVAWGAMHGTWLVVHRWLSSSNLPKWLRWALTFHMVCLTWLLFRAESFQQVVEMLLAVLTRWQWSGYATVATVFILLIFLPWFLYEAWLERCQDDWAMLKVQWPLRAAFYVLLVTYLAFWPPQQAAEFIYFQF